MSSPNQILKEAYCIYCKKYADSVCQRCGDRYCSITCQRLDWQRHRYICITFPPLIHANQFYDIALLEANKSVRQRVDVVKATASPLLLDVSPKRVADVERTYSTATTPKPVGGGGRAGAYNSKWAVGNGDMPGGIKNIENCSHSQKNGIDQDAFDDPETDKNIEMPKPEVPKPNSQVILTSFSSPNRVYIRELNAVINLAYYEVLRQVKFLSKNAKRAHNIPKNNAMVLVKRDGIMYRGNVRARLNHKNLSITLVDYGFTHTFSMTDIYTISDVLQQLPIYIMHVQLKDVPNYSFTSAVKEYTSKLESLEYKIAYDPKYMADLKVELFEWRTDKSMNQDLIERFNGFDIYSKNSTMENKTSSLCGSVSNLSIIDNKEKEPEQMQKKMQTSSENNSSSRISNVINVLRNRLDPKTGQNLEPVLTPPFTFRSLSESTESVDIFITDNSNVAQGFIGCLDLKIASNLAMVQKYLVKYNDPKPYNPTINEYVIAKFENDWYRAKVVQINTVFGAPMYTTYFIDFTNECTNSSDSIRRYPDDLTIDCVTCIAMIEDLPMDLTPAQVTYLQNQMPLNTVYNVDSITEKLSGLMDGNESIVSVSCKSLIESLPKS